MEVTPDESRVFVADGAVITVLNGMLGPQPAFPQDAGLQAIEVPDASPMALRYFELDANTRQLFIAGGTHGPWRIDLCPGLFAATQTQCAESTIHRTQIDLNLASPPKRCVDIEIVEGNQAAGAPLLFALFAANSNPSKSASPSVLRAYKLLPNGTTPFYAEYAFPGTGTSAFVEQVATAMTWTPGDPNHVYVALGIDWLWSVDITSSAFSGARLVTAGISTCGLPSCPYGEMMRDVSGVTSAQGKHFVYAALEYGRILEYDLDTPTQTEPLTVRVANVEADTPCDLGDLVRIECISAVMEGNFAIVGVGLAGETGRYGETRAPYHPTGFWNDQCFGVGLVDPNGANAGECEKVVLYGRCTQSSTGLEPLPHGPIPSAGYWNNLILRTSGWALNCYQSTQDRARLHQLVPGMGPLGPMGAGSFEPYDCVVPLELESEELASYAGVAFSSADGILSVRDPDLAYVGHDGGLEKHKGRMAWIQPTPLDILPVVHTVSVCAARTEPIPPLPPGTCAGDLKSGDPCPFKGAILGAASWPDANDPDVEWFLTGGDIWRRADPLTCDVYDPPGTGLPECLNPCEAPLAWVREGFNAEPQPDVGWKLARMSSRNPAHVEPDGINLAMKWWQFESPSEFPGEGSRAIDVPYLSARADPRTELANPGDGEPMPVLIFGGRGGGKRGLKVFRPEDLMLLAAQDVSCGGAGSGWGENLVQTGELVPYLEAMTHPEFETPHSDPPCLLLSCGTNIARHVYNDKLEVFPVTSSVNETRMIAIMAAGHIATQPSGGQPPTCTWDGTEFDNHPLLISIFDVTNTPAEFAASIPPQLIRVGIGPDLGHAFAVRAKTYQDLTDSPTYAFVANFTGTLEVFDISYDVLFSPTPPATGTRYWPGNPLLTPVPGASLPFPKDPYEGHAPNVVDIEIDGDFAYCALARAGIAVVDISDPTHPILVAVLDTPGLAQGLMLRQDDQGRHQLLVGDKSGMRLYGIPGEY